MSGTEQTYTKYISDMLLHAVGGITKGGIAILSARLTAFAKGTEEAQVSIDELCELFDCSENTIKSYAKTLSALDVWHLKTSCGKGHVSVWLKGSNFDTYQNNQKYQSLSLKVSKFDTNNKDNTKEREGAHTCVSTPSQPAAKISIKRKHWDTPCNPQNEAELMTSEFIDFWDAFHATPEYECEKARCAGIFAQMGTLLREDIVKSLKAYNRRPTRFHLRAKKDNPRYFLQDYVPSSLRLAPKGSVVTYQQYVKFYNTDLEYDGWKRIHIPEEQRTIFRKES